MTKRILHESLVVVGLALGWGTVGGLVASSLFETTDFASSRVALRYLAASGLFSAVACVLPSLVVWGLVGTAMRRFTGTTRYAHPLVAVQITALVVPLALSSLLYAHKNLLPRLPATSAEGLALSAGFLLAVAVVAAFVAFAVGRRAPHGGRRLAPAGWALVVAVAIPVLWFPGVGSTHDQTARPNVLVLSIDSLRRDVFYEYLEEHASSVLRRFVKDARHYVNAHTTYSHSLPSHASLLTGLYPPEHGAVIVKTEMGSGHGSRLNPSVPTLAEVLGRQGYETIAIVANPWLGPPFGLEGGFQTFVNYGVPLRLSHFDPKLALDTSPLGAYARYLDSRLGRGVHPNTSLFLSWLRSRSSSRPFFAFLHYIDMHTPSDPPAAYRERFCSGPFAELGGLQMLIEIEDGRIPASQMAEARAHVRNLYLAELARMDDLVRPVLEELLEGGWLGETLVFLVSDHGENLYEKGYTYGKSHVYETSGGIPFVVRVPGEKGGSRHDDVVSLVDVPPTIYGILDLPIPPGIRGVDLFAEGPLRGAEDWVYLQGWDRRNKGEARALVFGNGLKLIRDGSGRDEIYDLVRDPRERHDLSANPGRATFYRRRFEEAIQALDRGQSEAIDPENLPDDLVERLRAMGYLR